MEARDIILNLDLHFDHDWDRVYKEITEKTFNVFDPSVMLKNEVKLYALLSEGYKIVTILDDEYPAYVKQLVRPPFVIYYKCNIEDLELHFKEQVYGAKTGTFID